MVDTLEIIHDELAAGTYRFLADFFRLVGTHVRDATLENENSDCSYDCVIIVTDQMEESNLEVLKKKHETAYSIQEMAEASTADDKKQILREVLSYIRGLYTDGNQTAIDVEYEALKKIADIYVDHDIMCQMNAYTYFHRYPDIVKEAQKHLADAYIALRDSMKEEEKESKYAIYAMVNLARCINESCRFCGERLVFDTGVCLSRLDNALAVDPRFYNVYILKAFLAEGDAWHSDKAGAFFKKALEKIGYKPYMSYPCYRLGRYYERTMRDQKLAVRYYKDAQKLNVIEYRSVYKIMRDELSRKKYFEALESCKEICNILQKKKSENYLQPREYEYLFKAYHEEMTIYKLLGNMAESNSALIARNQLCEEIRRTNKIYRQTFGSLAEKFAGLTADQLLKCVGAL